MEREREIQREREIKALREFSTQLPLSRQHRSRVNNNANQSDVGYLPSAMIPSLDQLEGIKRMTPPLSLATAQRNIAVPPLERNV